MKDKIRKFNYYCCNIIYVLSIVLLIASFLLPPIGFIDNSVLMAGSLMGFLTIIMQLPEYIDTAKQISIEKDKIEISK